MNPKIVFDEKQWKQIESMASIFCTGEEIANILDVHYDTLEARIKETYGIGTSDFLKKYQSAGKASLRRTQYKAALEDKNITMLIWLGKQHLGQTDKNELMGAGGLPLQVQIIAPSTGILNANKSV